MALLEVRGLHARYGHTPVLHGIDFQMEHGSITALLGANGAGKTTTLKTISGLRKVRAGVVRFDGRDITNLAPYDRVRLGISQSLTYQLCQRGKIRHTRHGIGRGIDEQLASPTNVPECLPDGATPHVGGGG